MISVVPGARLGLGDVVLHRRPRVVVPLRLLERLDTMRAGKSADIQIYKPD